jgi:hypothetical protein
MEAWYRLDNAAKVFPAVTDNRNTSVFRVAAVLRNPVDPVALQPAASAALKRFPSFSVRVRSGLFWNYLESNPFPFFIEEERDYPCYPMDLTARNRHLVRVLYSGNRVAVEAFHAVTDGSGATEFLKCVLLNYFAVLGRNINPEGLVLTDANGPRPEEAEDGFALVNTQGAAAPARVAFRSPYRLKGTPFDSAGNNVIHGTLSARGLNEVSRAAGGTMSAYLAAALIHSMPEPGSPSAAPVVVAVPVNLRKAFPSPTVRNFFGLVTVGANIGRELPFAETVKAIDLELKEKTSVESLRSLVRANVSLEKNRATRAVPLRVKDVFVNIGFNAFGENAKSVSLSNLGKVSLPSGLAAEVARVETVLYPTPKSPINCGVSSVNDALTISFTRSIREAQAIRRFFGLLARESGLEITVDSNDWGIE